VGSDPSGLIPRIPSMKKYFILAGYILVSYLLCLIFSEQVIRAQQSADQIPIYDAGTRKVMNVPKVKHSDDEWKQKLSPEQYHILREKGTERAFTGKLWDNKAKGMYVCAACKTALFSSDAKYDSKTGWPSFYEPVAKENVATGSDNSFFMKRTEVHCARCGGHLGHIFDDGPEPTGKRYCINSASLDFTPMNEKSG